MFNTDTFQLVSDMQPKGDQPKAIESLVSGIESGMPYQTLMGATGTGKTFTMANVIAQTGKPTLVMSHNKTLAAQLYEEFKELFPNNPVCYFVSYYDYYQPEAYIPQRGIYIEKDSSRNDNLDRLRLAATSNLISSRACIIVASVSCIFGLGSPDKYKKSIISLSVGQELARRDFFFSLNDLQYKRSDIDLQRGTYRVRGDVIEVHPANEEFAYRIELFGDEIDKLQMINPLTGELLAEDKQIFIFPAVHYVVGDEHIKNAIENIKQELHDHNIALRSQGKLLEAQRIAARTRYDLEMIEEVGYCSGIENYSRHLDDRPAGSKPYTLMDYYPEDDWMMIIDESHATVPQLRAMYNGDQARKRVLVEHGFRLPSAMDNRPMQFEEIEKAWGQVIFVSATPGPYELEKCAGHIIEQVIRPTGLVDPEIVIRPAATQVPDLLKMARGRIANNERTLVTTITKRLAENLATYLAENGIKCRYLHSDILTPDRVQILRELREGEFDVLVGVNLLREGLDLPEVSLVAIMDADKAGFLRSATSLIQQIGRAARNANSIVVLYADKVTPAMQQAIDETDRRRVIQTTYNKKHGITPQTIIKEIRHGIEVELRAMETARAAVTRSEDEYDRLELIKSLEDKMFKAADSMAFERAAALRDQVKQLKDSPELEKVSMSNMNKRNKPKPGTPGTKVIKNKKKKKSSP
ncbi:MAG: excinuclease ABC subunit UvrB [Phycisphaeraceae bacterium]|nr:excinuclease ABC subunit UvrB [Phycisphaeraceae bacterium]